MIDILKKHSGKAAGLLLIIIAAICCGVCFILFRSGSKQRISVTKNAVEMGTAVSLTVYGEQGRLSEQACRDHLSEVNFRILKMIGDLDRYTLSWRSEDSEVYRFNRSSQTEAMSVSPELAEVIRDSLELSRDSHGALDITLRSVIDLWGIESFDGKTAYIPPSSDEIEKAAASVGYEHLTLTDAASGEILLEKDIPELSLDLGAVGKGYALDLAAEELAGSDTSGAVLAAGGSILAYGDKGEPWKIGIRDPESSPSDLIGIISVPGESGQKTFISTSGGYEKYVEYEGKILQHIIDGRTLYPAESGLVSVTVVTKDSGLASDGLSTACFILGMEESKPLLESRNAEAVFITGDKTVWLTAGLTGRVTIYNSEYSVKEVL